MPLLGTGFGVDAVEVVNENDIKIGRQIGGGGFAIVYAGKWKGKPVALKTLVRKEKGSICLPEVCKDLA